MKCRLFLNAYLLWQAPFGCFECVGSLVFSLAAKKVGLSTAIRGRLKERKKVKLTAVPLHEKSKKVKAGMVTDIVKIRLQSWLGKINFKVI